MNINPENIAAISSLSGLYIAALKIPQKIREIVLHRIAVAGAGVRREILHTDDAEPSEIRKRAYFGRTHAVTTIAVVQDATGVRKSRVRLRGRNPSRGLSFWTRRPFRMVQRRVLAGALVGVALGLGIERVAEIVEFAGGIA
jgi:hypothetical protein